MFRSIPLIRDQVITPVLEHLAGAGRRYAGINTPDALALLLRTAAAESEFAALRQVPTGPALSLWQIEPETHDDLWSNFLAFHPDLAGRLRSLTIPALPAGSGQLAVNLPYACAVARLCYWRRPERMPPAQDLLAQAQYWKAWFNTPAGAGTVEDFRAKARRLSDPHLTHILTPEVA